MCWNRLCLMEIRLNKEICEKCLSELVNGLGHDWKEVFDGLEIDNQTPMCSGCKYKLEHIVVENTEIDL